MMIDRDLASLQRQLTIVTDRVRGVATGGCPGLYVFGRAGTSKTYTVTSTLDSLKAPYVYQNGRLTAAGLFDVMAEHADQTIVLDDVSLLFQQPLAVQLLLAALGATPRGRHVRFKTAKKDRSVEFTGGVIAISNLPLEAHDGALMNALKDRIHVIQYEPSDAQIQALMQQLADQGIRGTTPDERRLVLSFLLEQSQQRGIRPSLRLFVDKALADLSQHARGETQLDWRDLIITDLEQQLIEPEFPVRDLTRADTAQAERRLVASILKQHATRPARVSAWVHETGKSQASFYRRLSEINRSA